MKRRRKTSLFYRGVSYSSSCALLFFMTIFFCRRRQWDFTECSNFRFLLTTYWQDYLDTIQMMDVCCPYFPKPNHWFNFVLLFSVIFFIATPLLKYLLSLYSLFCTFIDQIQLKLIQVGHWRTNDGVGVPNFS